MLHEAIFLATRIATNVALQVARKNSRVIPHFATAIVALRVARKVERPSTLRDIYFACDIPSATRNAILSEWANQSSSFGDLARPPSCLLLVALQVAKEVANV